MRGTTHTSWLHVFLGVCAPVVCSGWVLSAEIPARVRALLHERLALSTAEVAVLDRGRPLAKSLRTGDRREIAAAGAVRVDATAAFFLQRFIDIVSFKQSPIVRQIGKFSEPPRIEDLAPLTFEPGDLDALRRCRVGACDIQLSADQIARIQAAVDWSKPDARAQANLALRELLLEYVVRYRNSGSPTLLEYANEKVPLKVRDEQQFLVANSGQILTGVPEFSTALLGPAISLHGTQEFIYWSKEQFGLKPVVSITHVVIYLPRRPDVPEVLIASKQIYASRYLAGSLAITVVIEAPALGGPGFYMAYANRSRPRAFPPVIGGLVRRVALAQSRDGLEEQLQLAKERLEAAFRASPQ